MSDIDESADVKATWWLYIIETEKGHLYTGITTDVDRRFQEHQDTANRKKGAKGAKFFRSQMPLAVMYKAHFADRSEASSREAEIKKMNKRQKLALINEYGGSNESH